MLSLSQRQALQQKLSPQQIQYQKLLQLNTLSLEQRIKTELELNPILEEIQMDEYELSQEENTDEKNDDTYDDIEEVQSKDDEFEIEDFMNESDHEEIRINKSPDDDDKTQPISPAKTSLNERLYEQLHMLDISEEEMILGETIINSLRPDGYF